MAEAPVRTYSVVATQDHVDAMARVSSGPRDWGLLPWLGVPAGVWFGFVVGARSLPEAARDNPALGWLMVLGSATLGGWLMARYARWTVRTKMRKVLTTNGWHVGSEHHAEFREESFMLRGPTSQVAERYDHLSSVKVDHGGILMRRRESRTPLLSVRDLFPDSELDRVRRGIADAARRRR